jgi:hypothetical protein
MASATRSEGVIKMADIRNPLTGRVFKQVDSTLAEILVEAQIMVYNRAEAPAQAVAPRPAVNTFSIGCTEFGKPCITLTTPTGQVMKYMRPEYTGDLQPDTIRNCFKNLAWSGAEQKHTLQGPEVPEQIVREFIGQAKYEARIKGATATKLEQARDSRA